MVRPAGFFDVEGRITALVHFTQFRPALERAVPRAEGKKGGRPAFDHVPMFKMRLLLATHGLARHRMPRDSGSGSLASGQVNQGNWHHPVLGWLRLGMWLKPDGFWVMAGVLLAAMPMGTNAFLLSRRHGARADGVAVAALLSTVAGACPATARLLGAPLTRAKAIRLRDRISPNSVRPACSLAAGGTS